MAEQDHQDYRDSDISSDSDDDCVTIAISYRQNTHQLQFHTEATVAALFTEIEETWDIPVSNQKILVPKGAMLKWPVKEPDALLLNLAGKTLKLMGSPSSEVTAVQNMCERVAKREAARREERAKNKARHRAKPNKAASASSQYSFGQVKPLQGLPRPERSMALLLRLKEDPGIKATMKKHKFTVALLTEMEPLSNTQSNHEGTSRILGLNRNKGEVIELRLRTDAYDGYRDYKTIRKTLCHELAHNVHSDHDRHFWDLCHQIEREVDAADWKSGGNTVSGESSRYVLNGQEAYDDDHGEDDGGWTGGEFVLGGRGKASIGGMSRRDILARAAVERQRKEDCAEAKAVEAAAKGWRPCQRQQPSDDGKE
ncbi:hypothetical protein VHEMI01950 [[Torrubiella] hemipterigena]|uniref:WLM domain-containing protein n=1 Tax=[Torrubiella] hemipterigena TaxID=1531966 RepID=A0A0A1T6R9_9HYPO|nr:hypothetical protein VHEMI01950 [[Torrubiella] hemipterigena]